MLSFEYQWCRRRQAVRAFMTAGAAAVLFSNLTAWAQWPQWGGANRDFTAPAQKLATEWPTKGPRELWSTDKCTRGITSLLVDKGIVYLTGRFDDWEYVQNRPMEIPNAPLLYHATDYPIVIGLDSGQFVDPLAIAADTLSMPGTVTVSEWPTGVTNTGRASSTWWAGHQTLAEIPTEIRHAGVMLVAHYFENREATSDVASIPVPYAVDALLASA